MPEVTIDGVQYLVDLDLSRVALCNQGANSRAHIVLTKRKEFSTMSKTFDELMSALKTDEADVIKNHIADVTKAVDATALTAKDTEIADLKKQLEAAQKAKPVIETKAEPTSLEKSINDLSPELRAHIQDLEKSVSSFATAQAESLANERFQTVKALPADEVALKDILKTCSPATYDILVKASNAITEGLLKVKGSEAPASPTGSGAYDKLEKAAKDIQKTDTGLTFEQAFMKAVEANPTLYTDYKKGE